MIKRLEVEGLNNRLDAAMDFNEDLNIITGRNGSGKTTLLKLIWYLISGNLTDVVSEIPFRSVSIHTDAFSFSIERAANKRCKLDFQPANKKEVDLQPPQLLRVSQTDEIAELGRTILDSTNGSLFFPSFRRIEGGFDRLSAHEGTAVRVHYRHSNQLRRRVVDRATERLQEAMYRLSNQVSVINHKFIASISTHDIVKLLTEKYADVSKRTNDLSVKLSKEISQKTSDTKASDDANPALTDIKRSVEQFTKEQDSLLRPFSVLSEQIPEIFEYEGIRVTDAITLGNEQHAIDSDLLSSGEKQMLSFLCYNTFVQNTPIFIDEPELSLHVDWQRLLLPTLLEQDTNNQFFIATHSPFIYSRYPEKEILLGTDRGDS